MYQICVRRCRWIIFVLILGELLGACDSRTALTALPTADLPTLVPPTPTATKIKPTATTSLPTPGTSTPATETTQTGKCALGLGLRQETVAILMNNKEHPGMVMSASAGLSERYFPELQGWVRILGAPSLEALQQKAERAMQNEMPYEALGYGLETSQSTPGAEWRDLIGSTQKAREIAGQYGKMLAMGPGFRLMSSNEDKYPEMAGLADLWIFQTQQLQKNPPGPVYRQEVERIVGLIRSGNPDIPIWAQITLPPDREPDAKEWLAYRETIADLVDGTYIGVYTWNRENEAKLVTTIEEIFSTACENQ